MRNVYHNAETQQINYLDNRYYTNDGLIFFPSVTTILEVYPKGFGFNQWLKDVGNNAVEIADRAAVIGSKIHDACDQLNNGREILWADEKGNGFYSIDEWKMILNYSKFWELSGAQLIASETNFCSGTLGYGGTIDLIVMINGKRWLIDIKTSNYLHTSHELQVAAYANLWNESNEPIDQTAILWLKAATRTEKVDHSKGIIQGIGWQVKTFDRHYRDAFKIFQHTHEIWKEENPRYVPLNMVYPDRMKLEMKTPVEA